MGERVSMGRRLKPGGVQSREHIYWKIRGRLSKGVA